MGWVSREERLVGEQGREVGGRARKRGWWASKEERLVASKDEYIVFYSHGHVDTKNL